MTWLRRNAGPIAAVLAAAALVIVAFEVLDLFTGSSANDSAEEAETTLTGIAAFAGLIKVVVIFAIPFALTLLVRRWTTSSSPT